MNNLQEKYNSWRKTGEEAIEDTNMCFTWDCGEASAREDFSNFADLKKEISFDEMFELEKNYQ